MINFIVSVSLRSIIHSYIQKIRGWMVLNKFKSFRLLMEYHSFLQSRMKIKIQLLLVSVSLWSIIHSYYMSFKEHNNREVSFPSPYGVSFILTKKILNVSNHTLGFPSPYGVSFILTKKRVKHYNPIYKTTFRLLTEYHSFLWE